MFLFWCTTDGISADSLSHTIFWLSSPSLARQMCTGSFCRIQLQTSAWERMPNAFRGWKIKPAAAPPMSTADSKSELITTDFHVKMPDFKQKWMFTGWSLHNPLLHFTHTSSMCYWGHGGTTHTFFPIFWIEWVRELVTAKMATVEQATPSFKTSYGWSHRERCPSLLTICFFFFFILF